MHFRYGAQEVFSPFGRKQPEPWPSRTDWNLFLMPSTNLVPQSAHRNPTRRFLPETFLDGRGDQEGSYTNPFGSVKKSLLSARGVPRITYTPVIGLEVTLKQLHSGKRGEDSFQNLLSQNTVRTWKI